MDAIFEQSYAPTLYSGAFEYLKPTDEQMRKMDVVRAASAMYAKVLDEHLPNGPDKTFVLRAHRSNAMWANVAITREANGAPRA